MPRPRRIAAAAATLLAAVSLAACTQDQATEDYLNGENKGFISSEFRVDEIPADQRGEPVAWAGVTENGDELSSDDVAGDVVVVNFWYASCGPCIVEAPDLEAVWQEYRDEDVSFVGVNTYDQADTARSFAAENGVTYPSIIDVNSGDVKLAFAAATPIQATPTTLVLDREGRVAALVIGQLESPSILSTLVGDVLAES
ncbi:TlpA family protein disulfide reductase [Microbacterium sediminis]|uniref:Alkyl hydroperoxide reductase n=1 Tax=Microbacterium sediminis TaxID=904291 RepID=A0A1B9NDB3_9MICO|nr:TlpA disulfide reductase family protein [Microbacterium sediminis]OCG74591.1 alkyl hydroperoxide reductase [Microbacterium sediminis]